MRCKQHQWVDLYQDPNDSGFKEIYVKRELDAFKKCDRCGAIGKRSESGSILQLPKTKWDNHRLQASRWAENLETFATTQKDSDVATKPIRRL